MSIYLKIADAVNGKLGSVYFTVDGRRFEVPGIQKIEAHDTMKERSMTTVGTVKTQTAPAGVEGEGSMTIHYYAVSTFGAMIENYRRTGRFTPFDILIINEDRGTNLGRRTTSFSDCVLTGQVPLAVLDAETERALTIELHFKYGEYRVIEDFNAPTAIGRE